MSQAIRVVDRLQDLADFQGPPGDREFLVYDSASGKFVQPSTFTCNSDGSLSLSMSTNGTIFSISNFDYPCFVIDAGTLTVNVNLTTNGGVSANAGIDIPGGNAITAYGGFIQTDNIEIDNGTFILVNAYQSIVSNGGASTNAQFLNSGCGAFGSAASTTNQLIIACGSSTRKGMVVKGAASQSANLTEWQDSSSNPLTWVTSAGNFVSKIGLEVQNSSGGNLFKIAQSNPNIKIYSQGYATNPFIVYDSSGTNILSLSDVGDSSGLTTPNFQSFNRITGTNRIYLGQSRQGLHLHDGSGGTGSLMYVRWGDTYSGTNNSGITSAGSGLAQLKITDGSTGYGGLIVGAATTTSVPLTVKAIASQTSNLTEWQDSTSSAQLAIGPTGQIKTNQTAAGTTLGSVTNKMPIYDASGTLVGYVPIYDSIT